MVGSYSDVHCERTRRSVMDDLPQPPSPQMVMEMGTGGWLLAAPGGAPLPCVEVGISSTSSSRSSLLFSHSIIAFGNTSNSPRCLYRTWELRTETRCLLFPRGFFKGAWGCLSKVGRCPGEQTRLTPCPPQSWRREGQERGGGGGRG